MGHASHSKAKTKKAMKTNRNTNEINRNLADSETRGSEVLSHRELQQIQGGARGTSYRWPTDDNGVPVDPKDLPWHERVLW